MIDHELLLFFIEYHKLLIIRNNLLQYYSNRQGD